MNITRLQFFAALLLTLVLGVAIAWIARPILQSGSGADGQDDRAGNTQYTCPMHPSIVSDSPGTCPICHMDLIPKGGGDNDLSDETLAAVEHVALSPVERVLANVHTTVAQRLDAHDDAEDTSSQDLRATGILAADQDSLAEVPSWLDGRIETLRVKKVGTQIKRGQAILEIYAPDLYAAQQEFLFAVQNAAPEDAENPTSMRALTAQRLQMLGMDKSQIRRLEKDGKAMRTVTVRAPNGGTITDVLVRQGQYVETGTPLFRVEDTSTLRVEAAVRLRDLPSVAVGAKARIVAQESGASRTGRVEFISPTLDAATRTVNVRIQLDDAEYWLPKDAFVTAYIERSTPSEKSDAGDDAHADHDAHAHHADDATPVRIPRTAVIRGGITNRVYIETDDNVFEARDVEITAADAHTFVVHKGLKPGDVVVTSGVFLLDSEAQLHAFGGPTSDDEDHDHSEVLDHSDISDEGTSFDPSIPVHNAPNDTWLCNMGEKTHWIQKEEGDGICPLCNMRLEQRTADNAQGGRDAHDDHDTHEHHAEEHP